MAWLSPRCTAFDVPYFGSFSGVSSSSTKALIIYRSSWLNFDASTFRKSRRSEILSCFYYGDSTFPDDFIFFFKDFELGVDGESSSLVPTLSSFFCPSEDSSSFYLMFSIFDMSSLLYVSSTSLYFFFFFLLKLFDFLTLFFFAHSSYMRLRGSNSTFLEFPPRLSNQLYFLPFLLDFFISCYLAWASDFSKAVSTLFWVFMSSTYSVSLSDFLTTKFYI